MSLPDTDRIAFGGDYNPEQWPSEVWREDHAAFDLAHIDTLTVGAFAWSVTQPAEDTYDFSVLDASLDLAHSNGRSVCLATGTAAVPPWLAHRYPDACRTDFEGRRHVYGQRHNACPSSPHFRRLATAMAAALAERYANHPAVVAWHIGNEYGGICYCELCAVEFRAWLRARYGTLDELNRAWYTTFWSHRFTDWQQVVPPNALSEHWRGPDHTAFQGISVDYLRFNSDNLLRSFREEKQAIAVHSDLPVTTNFMGAYKPIDYHRWAPHLDFASWDNYPPDDRSAARMAFQHALMRGLKDGQPFWLMEQAPSATATRDVNPVKRPGIMRLWSWQAVACGADAVLFFQMRRSRGASEKEFGSVLDHAGRTDTRTFREVAALGAEFETVGEALLGARTPARVALLFDWDSWWAHELTDGHSRHARYLDVALSHHRALWEAGAQVDVVPVSACLDAYDVVVAPTLEVVSGDLAPRLEAVARRGGSVVITAMSGRVDQDILAFRADPPGPFAAIAGVRVTETDARLPGELNPVQLTDPEGGTGGFVAAGEHIFELLETDGAQVVGRYGADFYAGTPAVTRHGVGQGHVWYVGTLLDAAGLAWLHRIVLDRHGLVGPYAETPDLEHAIRIAGDKRFEFLLNHGEGPVDVIAAVSGVDLLTGESVLQGEALVIPAAGVLLLEVGR
ncbi:beta-galactosidase [Tessaracoccus sp. OS52]|uniref:beta-galactosidase n=1 Tax=Tessaracoccus sp. OS52 TaxID=2886691 RepID=UPI001D0F9F18|nr:beta-galactosidase [Tessaracoccus sp. OS52]MCC2593741.1 beta-galactosidase [Tessaracoccus sp. OS52]